MDLLNFSEDKLVLDILKEGELIIFSGIIEKVSDQNKE